MYIIFISVRGQSLESDVYVRQFLTAKDCPRAVRINQASILALLDLHIGIIGLKFHLK